MSRGCAALARLARTRWQARHWWLAGCAIACAAIVLASAWWLLRAQPGGSPSTAQLVETVEASLPLPPAPRPDHVVEFSDGCISAECHATMSSSLSGVKTVHEPVAQGACAECHGPDAGGHTFPLVRSGEALCSHCHQMGPAARFQHRAIQDEGCTACHDPHAAAGRHLLVGTTVQETCAGCHPPSHGDHQHHPYAAGQCDACHEPHGSATRALLRVRHGGGTDGIEAHCNLCHADTVDAMAAGKRSHRDVEGSCLACHGAHATHWKRLQRLEPRTGCIACHDDIGAAVATAKVSHDAVLEGDQCASCHEPHASANAMMVREVHAPVCMNCHSEALVASDGRRIAAMAAALADTPVVHGPVAAGNCASCHGIHGGEHARLLKSLNPKVLVGGFDLRNYAMCFSCHDPNLAISDAPEATQFRHGMLNLHRLHVQAGGNSDRSRSCAACHTVHGSDHPRLIAERVPYDGSTWMMPMGFYLTDDGGGCAPGCHDPLEYRRSAP